MNLDSSATGSMTMIHETAGGVKAQVDDTTRGKMPLDHIEEPSTQEPYSVYTRSEKWFIVGLVAVAGFFRHVLNHWAHHTHGLRRSLLLDR
jgi:hypothetical protein